MKSYLNKINWMTVITAVVVMYLVFQVDSLKDLFTSKNKFFN